jgi:hypothetical protein
VYDEILWGHQSFVECSASGMVLSFVEKLSEAVTNPLCNFPSCVFVWNRCPGRTDGVAVVVIRFSIGTYGMRMLMCVMNVGCMIVGVPGCSG